MPCHVSCLSNSQAAVRRKENLLSQLPGYAELSKNGDSPVRREVVQPEATDSSKGEARYCGQLFQHSIDRQVKRWKKANCSTILRRITRLKCVNSEIKSNVGSTTWKGIPRRAHVILSNRHEWHTCSEQLFELLTWNVSFMQIKTGHLAKIDRKAAQNSEMDWSSFGGKNSKVNMAVLGLAARHFGKNAGTGMCVHIPLRLNPIASLAWLGKQLPCPLHEKE